MEFFLVLLIVVTIMLVMLIITQFEDSDYVVIGISFVLVIIVLVSVLSREISKDDFYKQGQIDAIKGNIRYELVKQPNDELKWELKK